MPKIHALSESVVNKIAAGEVIERPSSVVKELVENSIDAHAKNIRVDIERSGKALIRVKDDGVGMSCADAKVCVLRHTTSKLRESADLDSISTLGFRGEALSSISAVSHFSLLTRERENVEGFRLTVAGGRIIREETFGSPDGTVIEVRDLFYNTPARKKFMRTDRSELRSIIDVMTNLALANVQVSFHLTHDGKTLLQTQSTKKLSDTITLIYGKDLLEDLIEVSVDFDKVSLYGYVSKPTTSRSDKSSFHLFVNNRPVFSPVVYEAVRSAYHSTLFTGRHPVVILNLKIDPGYVDVNVHPSKKEIKFDTSSEVYNLVYESVKNVLTNSDLVPKAPAVTLTNKPTSKPRYTFQKSDQSVLTQNVTGHEPQKTPKLKILGQIHRTFFVAETPEGLMIIDQHIVQERVLYEKFMRQYMENDVKKQQLLEPLMINLSPAESDTLSKNAGLIKSLGFDIEPFGEGSYLLRSLPLLMNRLQPKSLLRDVLSFESSKPLNDISEEIITRMSCRASVKAGDTVTIPQMYKLLEELDKCTLPFHCPHGRPIFIMLTLRDLEKMFKRVS